MRKEDEIISGEYGTHPMDKYDSQAQAPDYSGFACAQCMRDIQVGEEVWRADFVDFEVYVDSVGCLAMLTAKYEADIDDFNFTIIDGTEAD
ncbi:hypothetical protein [Oceanobacillus neutriphilus]|uniref:Phage protein n=1 Tax=Oceanobacillus neutriphilus TaxID=531815 RepID=A0ABQ2NYJ3_9BACI|nr:hypothetical protein [Oceanobacillus neutriphilus]GGP13490.1 hypothetical protein GCM10011346_33690 [Oceanobacillus neutriphilus]